MSVITPSNFDVKKLTVGEIKKLDNGGATVYLNYDGKRVRIQAPRLPLPMDASDYQGNKKFNVQFSFRDRANPKVAAYMKMLEDIDNFVIDQAAKNAGKWIKMPGASREAVSLFFTKSVRSAGLDKDGNPKDYPPTQKVALKERAGAFDAELYDDKKHLIEGVTPMEVLRRGAEITPICDATGIWIVGNKFGITWKLHQALINVAGSGGPVRGFLGVEEDTPVVAGAGGVSAAEEKDLMSAVMPSEDADDDEDEDDDLDEEEHVAAPPVPAKKAVAAAPAPAPATVKKVVKKVVAK